MSGIARYQAAPDQLAQAAAQLDRGPIAVVGDLILDEYLWGTSERISPEAPVPVVLVRREEVRPGGAGNVALNLRALGATVELGGLLGEDRAATRILDALPDDPGLTLTIVPYAGRVTPIKSRLLAGNQQVVRIDRENSLASDQVRDLLAARLRPRLAGVRALILSDYAKGTLGRGLTAALIGAAHAAGALVVVDPKVEDFDHYRGADLVTPNLSELRRACGRSLPADPEALVAPARELLAAHELGALAITLGELGILIVTRDEAAHVPATARQVFDVTGAGDTVVATITLARLGGCSWPLAAALANLAAGVVIGRIGAATVTRHELQHALSGQPRAALVSRAQLAEALVEHRAAGRRVVFTNGCFDLLHHGHVRLLEQARAAGDVLVVGLNSDESVRRLKGPTRPLLSLAQRAAVLGALQAVDHVVAFEEDTPLELIRAILPDVLVKGGDYTPEQVVGRAEVEAAGGRLLLVELVEGVSTTRLAERLANRADHGQGR